MMQPPSSLHFEGRAPGCNGKGIVELFMFKTDVARYILGVWAPVNMPTSSQTCIEKMIMIFSSVKSYRAHCGYPGKKEKVDMTWRAGWTRQMDELFTFVENVLFDQLFDGPLKEGLKRGQLPEELMSDEMFHEVTERVKNLPGGEEEDDEGNHSDSETLQRGGTNNDGKTMTKEIVDVEEVDGENVVDDTPNPQKAFDKAVVRLIDSHIVLIPDKGGPDLVLAEAIAQTAACKYSVAAEGYAGKGHVLINVDPSNIGESSSHPHLRNPPCNQDIVNRCVNVGLMARSLCEEGMASTEKIMEHDCWLLFEGGRNIENMLLKGFKGPDGRMIKKSKFVLTVTFDEQSIIDNIGRATQMGSISCTDRCIMTTRDELSLPRRNRTNYKGDTFFNFQIFKAS